ncbi:SPOR domain-containing protein [Bordetella holmesii]|uniref:Sporulation and cell division repeat protein n=1 Tax=Bordetella holmesii CDC-H585-BH TaxID=1331206 RepID=A0A158M1M5_9BORD|nr:SPOR domain-containing protein [Bordetella holmesii]AHV94651.1 sporulation related domain protein [Bordetella holmesii ATCC 51541]AIT28120.1 sporulation related domain protein [Bordetella holmesii 44057]EWM42511.1 sporulation related domain protein [Bordetella holmesii 41130]AMD46831.1 sporulation protein [Bordetella holmesii H558]AMD47782.1 sporulation protein [Bordetella holmesii F627]
MGLFTRKDSASESSPSRPRPSVSSEAQAAELRGRARRRLAGAVALVLAAVIVLPMMLDSEPVPVSDDIPVRIPDRNSPYQPNVSEPVAVPQTPASPAPPADTAPAPAAAPDATVPPPEAVAQVPAVPPPVAATTPPPRPLDALKPVEKPALVKPADKPKNESGSRSDDGARALALLEGRTPAPAAAKPVAKPAAKGNFVLQVASYTTQTDARERRGKLHQAGVTNAFVEQATISGKQQYRLRVGPFPSREAAQAAQARLRTLGYDNGFIAAQ